MNVRDGTKRQLSEAPMPRLQMRLNHVSGWLRRFKAPRYFALSTRYSSVLGADLVLTTCTIDVVVALIGLFVLPAQLKVIV